MNQLSLDRSHGQPTIGEWRDGYSVPVINERAVRAAAGLLFLGGATTVVLAVNSGSSAPLQPFGMLFLIDMAIRLLVSDRWAPSLALGRLIVRGQTPEWVGAPQKGFAWSLGIALAFASCLAMGFLNLPLTVIVALCGVCLTLLFVEASFGICVGCQLQRFFSRTTPQHCPGGVCSVNHNPKDTPHA